MNIQGLRGIDWAMGAGQSIAIMIPVADGPQLPRQTSAVVLGKIQMGHINLL